MVSYEQYAILKAQPKLKHTFQESTFYIPRQYSQDCTDEGYKTILDSEI